MLFPTKWSEIQATNLFGFDRVLLRHNATIHYPAMHITILVELEIQCEQLA